MIRVRQVKILVEQDSISKQKSQIAKKLHIKESDIQHFQVHKQSLDARKKDNIYYVYEFDVDVTNEDKVLAKTHTNDILKTPDETYQLPNMGTEPLTARPVIIGSGPAGLFAGYILAQAGYRPLMIERGEAIADRQKTVENFWNTGQLNPESNVQFGEGGAGTFSDGKLNTLVKDKMGRGRKVFETFVKYGAPKEILYLQKPHIGTDLLSKVITNMRNDMIQMGAEFHYSTCFTNMTIKDYQIQEIELNHNKTIPCQTLVLALGHSARDTFSMLLEQGIQMEAKPFALGLRVQHPQDMIDLSQYGEKYAKTLSPASPLSGIEFQRKLEEKAFQIGQGSIPVQLWKDFKKNQVSTAFVNVTPQIKGAYRFGNLRQLLPESLSHSLLEAIPEFGKKIHGFDREDFILAGIESRTSSPVRMNRDENLESNIKGVYPCGEGAGYAGGITTAAIDGIKVAEEIIKKYKNME